MRLAILEATLKLYRDPDRLAQRLPTLRLLARPKTEIAALAGRLVAPVAAAVGNAFAVEAIDCNSQIGSGALPLETVPSAGLAIRPRAAGGRALTALAAALRRLPMPVIGRVEDRSLVLDLRCLEDESGFLTNLGKFDPGGAGRLAPNPDTGPVTQW
jgi:L-seryl-tRNA(Ser) seleniumtransferase